MEASAARGERLPRELSLSSPVEAIAVKIQVPVELLKLSAEGLVEELRAQHRDPTEISAAETLIDSAEQMRRIVQALLEVLQDERT
jgi:hypothetical protein